MGFHDRAGKYKKLDQAAKEMEPTGRRRWRWMKVNGRLMIRGLRLSTRCRYRKLKIERKVAILRQLGRKIGNIYGQVVKRVNEMDDVCPQILLRCHWGLPVLSHHSTLKFSNSNYQAAPLPGL